MPYDTVRASGDLLKPILSLTGLCSRFGKHQFISKLDISGYINPKLDYAASIDPTSSMDYSEGSIWHDTGPHFKIYFNKPLF